jgi:hypothetical protein
MLETCTYDYAVIRFVPRVEREEFINVGVILSCPAQKFLESRIELDSERLTAFAPAIELETIRRYLDTIPKICAGDEEAGRDWSASAASAFLLADCTAQHDYSMFAGAYGILPRRRRNTGASAR